MNREIYIYKGQDEAFNQYRDGISFQKDIENIYENNDYKMRQPDLLGKTVKVTNQQFPKVFFLLKDLSEQAEVDRPELYVYEDYYYGAESYGIKQPWIEISEKTIQDFSEEELRFILAREIYKVSDGVTKQKTIMEMYFKGIRAAAPNELEQTARFSFYHWYRMTNFSADNYGYLMCGRVKPSINAILKMVLNSVALAEQVNIKEFIAQASEINKLDDSTSNYTKADEAVPYAPHRIQNILAYAINNI